MNLYGDYMTPPSLDKQVPHHAAEVYWRDNIDDSLNGED